MFLWQIPQGKKLVVFGMLSDILYDLGALADEMKESNLKLF